MTRLVLDTNVVVSALLWTGRPHELLNCGDHKNVIFFSSPPLLAELADEPTGNLDAANQRIVSGLLQDLHRNGHTIVMVTHDPEMAALAQRKIALSHGKVFCHPIASPVVTLRRRTDANL